MTETIQSRKSANLDRRTQQKLNILQRTVQYRRALLVSRTADQHGRDL